MSTAYELGTNSSDAVTLYPEQEYSKAKQQIRNEHRTRSGKLYLYKWGDYSRIKFDVNWVPASDAALVNSWFDTNTKLLFFVTSDSATEVFSVMLLNKETPLAQYNAPYNNLYRGTILLEGY